MSQQPRNETVRIELTESQKEQVKETIGRTATSSS
jgi:hypothetical protein